MVHTVQCPYCLLTDKPLLGHRIWLIIPLPCSKCASRHPESIQQSLWHFTGWSSIFCCTLCFQHSLGTKADQHSQVDDEDMVPVPQNHLPVLPAPTNIEQPEHNLPEVTPITVSGFTGITMVRFPLINFLCTILRYLGRFTKQWSSQTPLGLIVFSTPMSPLKCSKYLLS